jgi:hypothetical protein
VPSVPLNSDPDSMRRHIVKPWIEPPHVPELLVLENLALDAQRFTVLAKLEQIAVVVDEEFEERLAALTDTQRKARFQWGRL